MDNNLLQDVTYAPNTLSPPLSVSFPNCLSSPLSVSFPSFSTNMSKFLPVPRVARAGTTANSGDTAQCGNSIIITPHIRIDNKNDKLQFNPEQNSN